MKPKIFPPTCLNALLLVQIAGHLIFPIQQIVRAPYTYLGFFLMAISIMLNIYSVRYLARFNTSINFQDTANRLVVSGPFRRSRNPIYLSGVLLSFGIAIFLGSLITFVIPISMFMILNNIHIPAEERNLEELFGKEYLEYKQRVRRWI